MSKLQLLHIHTIIVKNGRKYHSGHEPIGTYLLRDKKNKNKNIYNAIWNPMNPKLELLVALPI